MALPATIKFPVYMRLARYRGARQGFYVDASPTPKAAALRSYDTDLPTIHFKLEVAIPREVFEPAKWPVIEVTLGEDVIAKVPIEVLVPEAEGAAADG